MPGRRQSPFQRCLLCRTRARAMGSAPPRKPRTATCDLSADAPHQATARNSHGTAAAMRAAAESPIPSRPPDARELFPTRVSVAPSGLSPPPALSTLRGGSRCGVRVRRASCGASPIAPGASATPRSLPRSSTRAWDKFPKCFLGIPSRTNTTPDPKSKAGPYKLHSKFPKSSSALGVLGSTVVLFLHAGDRSALRR